MYCVSHFIYLICPLTRSSEHGLATHYIPSSRVPQLLENLASLDKPTHAQIDNTIDELYQEPGASEHPSPLIGARREALDAAFSHDQVENIIENLEMLTTNHDEDVNAWAKQTLADLHMRSPTSLKVALHSLRLGKSMTLKDCFQMEVGIAAAFCVSLHSLVVISASLLLGSSMKQALTSILASMLY